jgi:HPt (histidine-containing phosphotransfer) domain-containing protein
MTDHIDQVALGELKMIMESDFDLLIETFVSDSRERITTLRTAVATGDAPTVRASAHSFKGSSLNICAPLLSELCRQLELEGKEGQLISARDLLVSIEVEFEAVCDSLKNL